MFHNGVPSSCTLRVWFFAAASQRRFFYSRPGRVMTQAKVSIVDDSAVVRQMLRGFLDGAPGLRVMGAQAIRYLHSGVCARSGPTRCTACGNTGHGRCHLPAPADAGATNAGAGVLQPLGRRTRDVGGTDRRRRGGAAQVGARSVPAHDGGGGGPLVPQQRAGDGVPTAIDALSDALAMTTAATMPRPASNLGRHLARSRGLGGSRMRPVAWHTEHPRGRTVRDFRMRWQSREFIVQTNSPCYLRPMLGCEVG